MGRKIACFAAVTAAALATAARADSVTVIFEGISGNLGKGVDVSLHNGLRFADGSSSKHVWAGQLSHRIDGVQYKTFCTELTQWAASGTFERVAVSEIPTDAEMGQAKAEAIYRLFNATNGGRDIDTASEAAAFQATIWEIVYDFGGGFGVSSGNVRISGVNSGLLAQYQGYAADTQGDSHASVIGYTHDTAQDQIRSVPLPGAAAMAGLGLAGVASRRRRGA